MHGCKQLVRTSCLQQYLPCTHEDLQNSGSTRFKPLFKCKFASQTDGTLIVNALTNYSMRSNEQCRNYLARIMQNLDVIDEEYDSYQVISDHPQEGAQGGLYSNTLLAYGNQFRQNYKNFVVCNSSGPVFPKLQSKFYLNKKCVRWTFTKHMNW